MHSTDTFGSGGKNALVEALKAHGIEPVLIQGYTNNSQDFTPIVLAIKKSGADVLATYMTNSPDVGIFAKQLRQLGVNVPWIGSASLVTDTAMKLAGESLWGTYSVADFVIDANEESKAFAKKYRARHGADPDLYSGWAYGAVYLIKHAIEKAKSTEPEAMRQALARHARAQRRGRDLRLRAERRRRARLQRREERKGQSHVHPADRFSRAVARRLAAHESFDSRWPARSQRIAFRLSQQTIAPRPLPPLKKGDQMGI